MEHETRNRAEKIMNSLDQGAIARRQGFEKVVAVDDELRLVQLGDQILHCRSLTSHRKAATGTHTHTYTYTYTHNI